MGLVQEGDPRGEMSGQLYGPDATEPGAASGITVGAQHAGEAVIASGVAIATRD